MTKSKKSSLFVMIVILPIKIYQLLLSPWVGPACRYQPTCSHYFIGAMKEHGLFRGYYLGMKRILRCHPWGGHGFDPVPTKSCSSDASRPQEEV